MKYYIVYVWEYISENKLLTKDKCDNCGGILLLILLNFN